VSTFQAKPGEIEQKWYVVDAQDMVLGRLSAKVATVLRGKHKPTYTPHVDTGDYVIIINADKVVLTGDKLNQKVYRTHSGYVGGLKETKYKDLMKRKPELAVFHAVRGMMPKGPLGRKMLRKLRIYRGGEHEQQAQMPTELKW